METVTDFIFLGSKISADGDCSHEIKRHLLLRGKAMTKLDSILKSRDITLPTKVHIVKTMIFPVVMYGYESWTIRRLSTAFELWCWRRLLRVYWTARRSNKSILNEISWEYLLEGLMLKLKLQYFGHLMWRADSLEKTLMLGQIEGRRREGQQRMRWLDGIIDSMDMLLLLSRFIHVWLCVTPWTVAHQASLSMEFSRQEYWNGLPLPAPGDLPYPGIKPESPPSPELAGEFFTTSTTWEVQWTWA